MRRLLPLFLMLTAGLITCIITFVRHYTMVGRLTALLVVFLVFYFIGSVIVYFLNRFDKENEKAAMQEDESVIEKDVEAEEDGSVAAKASSQS